MRQGSQKGAILGLAAFRKSQISSVRGSEGITSCCCYRTLVGVSTISFMACNSPVLNICIKAAAGTEMVSNSPW